MIQGQLKTKAGEVFYAFDIPESLSEVRLNQYIDFLVESDKVLEGNAVEGMLRAVNAFYGIPFDALAHSQVGDLYEESPAFDNTLRSLYGWATNLINRFTPSVSTVETSRFQYGGAEFVVPGFLQSAIRGEKILPNLSVVESIEAAEAQRRYNQAIEDNRHKRRTLMKETGVNIEEEEMIVAQGEVDKKAGTFIETERYQSALHNVRHLQQAGDPNGSLLYSQLLQLLAILYRQEGETLPIADGAREGWINNRVVFFAGIDAATALNCAFFLSNILPGFEGYADAVGFLTRQNFAVLAVTRLRSRKRTTVNRRTMNRFLSG